jgi:serine/threonine protein kinase
VSGVRQVGDLVGGRFEVFDVHEGGMGVVYEAVDRRSDTELHAVAVKTLRDEFLGDRTVNARFAAECRLWLRMEPHPNLVRTFALEEIDGKPHVVVELVRGGDLRRWIGTPRLDLRMTLRFGVEFCLGMEAAIRDGMRCHRDVKPGNLLVTEDGHLKITDFGLAMVREEFAFASAGVPDGPIPIVETFPPQAIIWAEPDADGHVSPPQPPPGAAISPGKTEADPGPRPRVGDTTAPASAETRLALDRTQGFDAATTLGSDSGERDEGPPSLVSRLTRAGSMIGTVPYMAPEQFLDASAVDVRADVYAFGVVLFEMIAGEPPFRGKTLGRLRRQHLYDDPPPLAHSIPWRFAREAERVESIVRRCLAKDPSDRFATIPALRKALTAELRRVGG